MLDRLVRTKLGSSSSNNRDHGPEDSGSSRKPAPPVDRDRLLEQAGGDLRAVSSDIIEMYFGQMSDR